MTNESHTGPVVEEVGPVMETMPNCRVIGEAFKNPLHAVKGAVRNEYLRALGDVEMAINNSEMNQVSKNMARSLIAELWGARQ